MSMAWIWRILVIVVMSIVTIMGRSTTTHTHIYTHTHRETHTHVHIRQAPPLSLSSTSPLVPSAPLNLTVKHVTSFEIHLTWAEPSGAHSSLHLPSHDARLGDPVSFHSHRSQSEYEFDIEPYDAEWKRFNRKRRRRETTVTDPTSEVEIVPGGSDIADLPTEKSDAMMEERPLDDVAVEQHPVEQQINYVLYYEEGKSGDSTNGNGFADELSSKISEVRNVVLAHQNGKDGLKGVKYSLKGLKPYTYYRIYVKAYYATSSTPSTPPSSSLGPASAPVISLTDVLPPSTPILKNLACDQPPGTLHIVWSRPEKYTELNAYILTIHRLGPGGRSGALQRVPLDTNSEHIETSISLPVDIINNSTQYEVTLQAGTKSKIYPNLLINGTRSDAYPVIMTNDCVSFHSKIGQGQGLGAPADKDLFTSPEIGYMIGFCVFLLVVLLVLLSIYRWGCSSSAFKKCFPVSYLFLEEGCNIVANEGFIDSSTPGKSSVQEVCNKKTTSPTNVAPFSWDSSDNNTNPGADDQLYDSAHPPVLIEKFLGHTAALHADGDIGFSKEYELIQTKSSLLGHTSHHSQHPENRHKNRYLNITAYDHSRVCLLPSSSCNCDGKEHRKSCAGKQASTDSPPHFDYVNANFIDGIVNNIDSELATFIIMQNNKRKKAQQLKEERINKANESQKSLLIEPKTNPFSMMESKLPDGFNNAVDGKYSFGQFEPKLPLNQNIVKDIMSLDLNSEKKAVTPGSEILASTCRLSINLDKHSNEDTKSEKSIKETKSKKRSTSADTKDIIIDKKCGSKGHSKNSSVVVGNETSPLNGAPKIEGVFLNIEFSGIVDSEIELQKAREAERLEEANRLSKEMPEETLDDLDDLYVKIGGESYRVKSSWLLDRRRYIGTQGPTPGTLPAFWRMVWDHNVTVIVMITNLIERGRRKCDMYWPKEGTESYGAIQVTILNEDVMATYTVRTFQIKNTKVGINRSILQYHYTVWPDHGTPEHPLAVLRFREAARKINQQQSGSILVHCSAGVGRTGTYIVLDAMLNHMRLTGSLNVYGFLCHIRTQRNFLVQTEEQYVFIHDALLEAIQSGDTEVPPEKSKEYLKKLLEPMPEGVLLETPINKCGVYGTVLSESTEIVETRNENDFFKNLEEVLKSVRPPPNGPTNGICNGINGDESNLSIPSNGLNNIDAFKTSSENCDEIYGDDVVLRVESPKSPHQKSNEKSEGYQFEDMMNSENAKRKSNANNSDYNDDALSDMNSTTGFNTEGEDSNMFENYNGNSIKDESKSNSLCNGESSDKLECNNSNNHDESVVSVIENTYSSISSDCNNSIRNNLSQAENDTPAFKNKNHDMRGHNNDNSFKINNDNNYELLSTRGNKEGSVEGYFSEPHRFAYQKKDNKKKARNLLEHQFKMATSFEPSKYHMVSACKQVNIHKNRHGAVLPIESGRVHLIPKPGVEGSDYINATWLQGHRSLREYIVTQHPLLDTIDDLYRMMWDTSSQLMVVLTDCDEDQECQSFWPTEEEPEINMYNFSIRFVSQEKYYARRKISNGIDSPSSPKNINISPLQSPNSGSSAKGFPLKLNKNSPKITPITFSDEESGKDLHINTSNKMNCDDSHDISFYRRQSSTDNQDEERLIPRSEDAPSLDCNDDIDELKEISELRKLNCEPKSDGFVFDKSELRIEVSQNVEPASPTEPKSAKLSKRNTPNGEVFSPNEDKKSHCKSPSKISLKSLKISSPVLKSPTKFKFDFGARISINSKTESDHCKSPPPLPQQLVTNVSFKPKFEMIPFKDVSQLRDGCEEISKDCLITATHITMSSTNDDYELRIKLIECPKWLADLDYDENSDTDEDSEDEEYEMETKALDFVIEQRLKAYKNVFGLPEYLLECQDDQKNSAVVIVDKNGGARATALCTLCGVLRQQSRDVYSFAKLHHGRRAGTWRRPADLRALYEALAAYENPPPVQHL